jgi:hypothetical protein
MPTYIKSDGIHVLNFINDIKKSKNHLQPIFEAFTNSLESLKQNEINSKNGYITISLFIQKPAVNNNDKITKNIFNKLVIEDNGIGFDKDRFTKFRDDTKGFNNRGTGRIQFLHFFKKTKINSIYKNKNSTTGFKQRVITLSKIPNFTQQNSVIRLEDEDNNDINTNTQITTITFEDFYNKKDKDYFSILTIGELKRQIIHHYLPQFCENRDYLPVIKINLFDNNNLIENTYITEKDIPKVDKEDEIEINYSKKDNKQIIRDDEKEKFIIKGFKLDQKLLKENGIKLVSKGEMASSIRMDNLSLNDTIDGKRYLFLLSSNYIDTRDSDSRGNISLRTKKEFEDDIFSQSEVLLDSIEKETNKKINQLYEEINQKSKDRIGNVKKLQKMFLLNPKTVAKVSANIGVNDTDETILKKIYQADSKISANKDAEITKQIKELEKLNPNKKEDYQKELQNKVNELTKIIPLQNKTELTQYVARRKLVLELFEKVLNSELDNLKQEQRIDEKLMHNLIFQQTSDSPETSDLWLINEDFIYFKGISENNLNNIKIDNVNILKEQLSQEEMEYKVRKEKDMGKKRPDILLFPKEGKCIIIELKAPEVNISEHLDQINRYASLINNLSNNKFDFNTFYGYLIGENINIDDIEDSDSDFKSAHSLNFIFRPYKRVAGKFGNLDGSLYTEIIKYSTLLERAKLRNQIFIEKLIAK